MAIHSPSKEEIDAMCTFWPWRLWSDRSQEDVLVKM